MVSKECKYMEGKFCNGKYGDECIICLLVIMEKHQYEIKKLLKSILDPETPHVETPVQRKPFIKNFRKER